MDEEEVKSVSFLMDGNIYRDFGNKEYYKQKLISNPVKILNSKKGNYFFGLDENRVLWKISYNNYPNAEHITSYVIDFSLDKDFLAILYEDKSFMVISQEMTNKVIGSENLDDTFSYKKIVFSEFDQSDDETGYCVAFIDEEGDIIGNYHFLKQILDIEQVMDEGDDSDIFLKCITGSRAINIDLKFSGKSSFLFLLKSEDGTFAIAGKNGLHLFPINSSSLNKLDSDHIQLSKIMFQKMSHFKQIELLELIGDYARFVIISDSGDLYISRRKYNTQNIVDDFYYFQTDPDISNVREIFMLDDKMIIRLNNDEFYSYPSSRKMPQKAGQNEKIFLEQFFFS